MQLIQNKEISTSSSISNSSSSSSNPIGIKSAYNATKQPSFSRGSIASPSFLSCTNDEFKLGSNAAIVDTSASYTCKSISASVVVF